MAEPEFSPDEVEFFDYLAAYIGEQMSNLLRNLAVAEEEATNLAVVDMTEAEAKVARSMVTHFTRQLRWIADLDPTQLCAFAMSIKPHDITFRAMTTEMRKGEEGGPDGP